MAEEIKFGIRLTGNNREAIGAIRETDAELGKLSASSGKLASQYSGMSAAQDKAAASARRESTEYRKLDADLAKLLSTLDPAYRATRQLDAANDLLHRGLQEGLITQKQYQAALGQIERQLSTAATGMNATGLSAKQTAMALRQVPMQFTDIVTALAAGQSPIQVFLQQGGQLKDLFGGAGAAASALGRYVLGLVNPVTLTIGAVVGLAAAFEAGHRQSQALKDAIILTGGAAGKTSSELNAMAESAGALSGRYTLARESIEALARSGRLSGTQFDTAFKGVMATVQATGMEVDEAAKKFMALAEDPANAVKELSKSYNFLTADIYKQITALQDQGRTQEAATLAMTAFADAMEDRKGQMLENVGLLERAWNGVKRAIDDAKDSLLSIGRDKTLDEQIDFAKRTLRDMEIAGAGDKAIEQQKALLADLARQKKTAEFLAREVQDFRAAEKDKIAAADDLRKYLDSDSRHSGTGLIAKRIEDENEAFARATRGLKKNSAEYQQALRAHSTAIENIRNSGQQKGNGSQGDWYADLVKQQNDLAFQEMQKLADQRNALLAEEQRAVEARIQAEAEDWQSLWAMQRRHDDEELSRLEDESAAEEARKASLQREAQVLLEVLDPAIKLNEQQDRYFQMLSEGMIDQEQYNKAIKRLGDNADDAKGFMKELGATFSSAFESAIEGGKKFSDVLAGLAQDIERLLVRRTVTDPLMKGIDGWLDSLDVGSWFSGLFANADGGVYAGPGISAYSGQIVSRPTIFPFARGIGLMGEAGPEAILPLRRGSDGKLGVQAGGGVNLTVNLIESPGNGGQVQQRQDTNGNLTLDIMVEKIEGMMARNIARGAGIAPTLERQYGLNRMGGAF